jgi:hypothetical protein
MVLDIKKINKIVIKHKKYIDFLKEVKRLLQEAPPLYTSHIDFLKGCAGDSVPT